MSSITVPNPANGCFLSWSSRLSTGCPSPTRSRSTWCRSRGFLLAWCPWPHCHQGTPRRMAGLIFPSNFVLFIPRLFLTHRIFPAFFAEEDKISCSLAFCRALHQGPTFSEIKHFSLYGERVRENGYACDMYGVEVSSLPTHDLDCDLEGGPISLLIKGANLW